MNNDKFIETFKEEALELLGSLENELLELEQNPTDKELLSSVFRVMHTIKGSAAMFGLDKISAFAHEVESIFSSLRDGKLDFSRVLIDRTLIARDMILELLDNPDGATGAIDPELRAFLEEFKSVVGYVADKVPGKDSPAVTPAAKEKAASETWKVSFTPGIDSFRRGSNPLSLVSELQDRGETVCVPVFDSIPRLRDFNPEDCLVSWEIFLTTTASENDLHDIFIFVEDHAKIEIECLGLKIEENAAIPKKLGEILIENGKVDQQTLDRILHSQRRIGEILVTEKIVSPTELKAALEEQKQLQKVQKNKTAALDMSTIRVKSEKLDQLMALVGELVTVHARIQQTSKQINNDELLSIVEQFGRLTDELRNNTMSIRMVTIGTTFSSFKRLVRDLSGELGKNVELETDGGDTELDKTVIEKLNDPLIHIIRNSLDHGIESPETRAERGKPRMGTIRMSASQTGASVYITVEDDGNGINKEAVLKKAVAKGLVKSDDVLTEQEIYKLLFLPGFSTKENVTAVSGRGVGMDVVNRQMELINGSITIDSKEKQFSRVTLKIPLTLAIIDGLLIRIAQEFYIIPLAVIVGCLEFLRERQDNDNDIVIFHDRQLPFVNMRDFFSIPGDRPKIEQIVVVNVKNQQIGILVDQVIGGNQTVIKPLGKIYRQAKGVSSASVLGDGSVALIMDVEQILEAKERYLV